MGARVPVLIAAVVLVLAPTAAAAKSAYETDLAFALKELEKQCGHFFDTKGIKWKKVAKDFKKAAKKIDSDEEHVRLMQRLLARLEDGHASLRPGADGSEVPWPEDLKVRKYAMGLYVCRIGKKVFVKTAFGPAKEVGIAPGCEVLQIDGTPAVKWLEARSLELSDLWSFSTDQQLDFSLCTRGLVAPEGTRIDVQFKDPKGKRRKRTITVERHRAYVDGPAFLPKGLKTSKDLKYGITEDGYGYVHVRRCKGDLPAQMDEALSGLLDVPGLILDFRGNSGGGFDHDALLGRFVPAGHDMTFGKRIKSAGPAQYGGPLVVIVDGTVVSAGETASGMFKEDGRGYMVGESPTAGMSSQKTTIELPSGKLKLYVSVASNKRRFNKGKGIEGIGVIPHEIVAFDPEDLAEERDTLIARAAALLAAFPKNDVPYKPKAFGWEPPK